MRLQTSVTERIYTGPPRRVHRPRDPRSVGSDLVPNKVNYETGVISIIINYESMSQVRRTLWAWVDERWIAGEKAIFHGQDGFKKAGYTGGRFRVADIALDLLFCIS